MPSWLEEMREERVVRYDTLRYPLAEAAAAVLELRPGETLDTLHLREVSGLALGLGLGLGSVALGPGHAPPA